MIIPASVCMPAQNQKPIVKQIHVESSPDIWKSLPQDILLVAHFRASDLVDFYNKHYLLLNVDLKKDLDSSIQSLEKETSLRFKEDLLAGLNGQYTLAILGDSSFLNEKQDTQTLVMQMLNNIIIIAHPKDYITFEKTITSLSNKISKENTAMRIELPKPGETSSILVPGIILPLSLFIYRDKNNTLYIGLDQPIKRIQDVIIEKVPALSSSPSFQKSFQHFRQNGQIISQALINPAPLAKIIQFFYNLSGKGDEQMREYVNMFLMKMGESSTLMAFQARSYEDLIISESTIPDYFYDLYFWIFVSSMSEGMNRAKQIKTITNMRTLSTLLATYMAEYGKYPPMNSEKAHGTVEEIVLPAFQKEQNASELPLTDGWNHPLYYEKTDDTHYTLKSYGKDGQPGKCAGESTNKSYDNDIVISSGNFTCLPGSSK